LSSPSPDRSTIPSGLARLRLPAAVVLGLGQNGLATVRALARRGVPVVAIDSAFELPPARTRYGVKLRCPDFRRGGEGLVRTLLELGDVLPHGGVLFPSGDLNLRTVSDHREVLARRFRFALPDRAAVDLVLNKRAFYETAGRLGFAVPETAALDAATLADVAGRLRYPAIVKPTLRDVSWRGSHQVKLYEVRSAAELCAAFERLRAVSPELIVQESIPGGDDQLFFSLTYLDDRQEPLAMFTGRKLRQYRPRFGTSSMAVSAWDPEVAATTLALLRAISYRGYASVEFKRDPRSGALKIIEVTGRTWYPHGLATRCGVNLPYLAYRHLVGLAVERPQRFVEGVKWIDEDRDPRAAAEYYRAGELGLGAWLGSYRGRRTYAIAAKDDPAPILFFGLRLARALLRRLRPRALAGRLRRAAA
jgi:predicted ATP-grasp superfamily ATP-dependent carboligase